MQQLTTHVPIYIVNNCVSLVMTFIYSHYVISSSYVHLHYNVVQMNGIYDTTQLIPLFMPQAFNEMTQNCTFSGIK